MDAINKILQQVELQTLQLQIEHRYLKNLEAFKHYLPEIANKFENRQAKTTLLKLDAENKLNLFDVKSQSFVYRDSAQEYCQALVTYFEKRPCINRLRVDESAVLNERHLHVKHLNRLVREYKDLNPRTAYEPNDEIINLLLTSIGLGYHIPTFIEKFNIHNLFIYENDLDVFQACLQVIDWEPILNYFCRKDRSITLCIGVKPSQALTQIELAISRIGLHNHIYTHMCRHSKSKVEEEFIQYYFQEMHSATGGLGYFDDEQIGLAHTIKNLKSKTPVFVYNKKKRSKHLPVLVIANGPSLDLHVEFLKKNQDSAILISCGSAFGSLSKMGIKPDFHVETERTIGAQDMLEFSTSPKDREGVTLLCLNTVPQSLIKLFDSTCFAKKPNDVCEKLIDDYFQPQKIAGLPYCNPTVANCGLAFAIQMAFDEIYLIGVDLGIKSSDHHHSKNSAHYEIDEKLKDESDTERFSYSGSNFDLKGNFGGEVSSHKTLNMARVAMERLIFYATHVIPKLQCFNSNDGVYIEGTLPIKVDDIAIKKTKYKKAIIAEIKRNNFHRFNNKNFNENNNLLNYFFSIEDAIRLSHSIETPQQLLAECQRVYAVISKENDNLTHILLRGSVNCFLSAIIQNCCYLLNPTEFHKLYEVGRKHYNDFLNNVYEHMRTEPYREDDSHNKDIQRLMSDASNDKETLNV